MGHIRLGTLPDTIPWRKLVALIAEDADYPELAAQIASAAVRGLELAKDDYGLSYTVQLLSQLVLAARKPRFVEALLEVSIHVQEAPGLFDIVSGFSEAIDAELTRKKGRTDLGEMGQLAAIQSLATLLRRKGASLFGTDAEDYRRAVYDLSTDGGFSNLMHEFFSRFCHRFLTYHLGREISLHVGPNGRFSDPTQHTQYMEKLAIHCREVAGIIREFAGEWYSKQNFQGGITFAKCKRFVNYCIKKIRDELRIRGNRRG